MRKPLNLLERENIQSKIANWFGIDFSKLQIAFRKARIKMLVSDQVAETCDACDRRGCEISP